MTSPMGPVADARVIRPLRDFLHAEAAGGIVLVAATVIALVWANSPFSNSYQELWDSTVTIALGDHVLTLDLRTWVNDGLMTVFFFVVGLEIKRELVVGELRDRRTATLPAVAAIGGMLVPAAIYLTVNAGGDGSRGCGIPMATDIAMALGALSLLGSRVNPSLKLFLLALAIVDDIGAIVVIAIFYSSGIEPASLAVSALLIAAVLVIRSVGVRAVWPYVVVGAGLWLAVHESGVHATITGVILGLIAPTRAPRSQETVDIDKLTDVSTVQAARETTVLARESVSVAERLEYAIHPWSSYVIVPLFALANAGVVISADSLADAAHSPITHGVVVGLVVGKFVGISAFAWLACRLRIASLPSGTSWSGIFGVSAIAGIGFTVSIFVSGLAFGPGIRDTNAKLGILVASAAAAIVGSLVLARRGSGAARSAA
ncbi:MAG: Na+/H+ antiporter NhaA [Acidimicrobiia bacterium]